jgi:hypothetical protein
MRMIVWASKTTAATIEPPQKGIDDGSCTDNATCRLLDYDMTCFNVQTTFYPYSVFRVGCILISK